MFANSVSFLSTSLAFSLQASQSVLLMLMVHLSYTSYYTPGAKDPTERQHERTVCPELTLRFSSRLFKTHLPKSSDCCDWSAEPLHCDWSAA